MTTDGTRRRHLGDEDLTAMTQLGTFAEYAVLAEESVIKIDESIPFEAASLVSCGVTTAGALEPSASERNPVTPWSSSAPAGWGSTPSRVLALRAPTP